MSFADLLGQSTSSIEAQALLDLRIDAACIIELKAFVWACVLLGQFIQRAVVFAVACVKELTWRIS